MLVKVDTSGAMQFIWNDELASLFEKGTGEINRASRVDFDNQIGGWMVDILTPFTEFEKKVFNDRHNHWLYKKVLFEGDCWIIPGAPSQEYLSVWMPARFGYGKVKLLAHRISFWLAEGYWPPVARHICDRTRCIRPSHLIAGTVKDNNRDAIERGRRSNGKTKLNPEIWAAIQNSDKPASLLAKEYGVVATHIRDIKKGLVGHHYTDPQTFVDRIYAPKRFGPFKTRTEAIAVEIAWLEENVIKV